MISTDFKTKYSFVCYIIGEESLLLNCGEVILEKGHIVNGVISSHPAVVEWAAQKKIPCFPSLKSSNDILLNTEYDYLFSIVNSELLSKKILSSPRKLTINYHDSLLPRYSGVHATSWAILNNEQTHGVTWHIVNNVIDGGDILKQAVLKIDEKETALTLNLKCYQKALELFGGLVDELADDSCRRIPQDLSKRSYNSFSKKPIGNGFINWQSSAENIDKLFRALQLGNYRNRLSLPKLQLGKEYFIVAELEITSDFSSAEAGTLVEVSSHGWRIATFTKDILLSRITTLYGENIELQTLEKRVGLRWSNIIPFPSNQFLKNFQEKSREYFQYENFWVQKWSNFQFTELPFFSTASSPGKSIVLTSLGEFSIPDRIFSMMERLIEPKVDLSAALLTIWIIYLNYLSGEDHIGILYSYPELGELDAKMQPLFSKEIPFSIHLKEEDNFALFVKKIIIQLSIYKKNKTHLNDLIARDPALLSTKAYAPISVWVVNESEIKPNKICSKSPFVLVISDHGRRLTWLIDKSLKKENIFLLPALKNIPTHIENFLDWLIENKNGKISGLSFFSKEEYENISCNWSFPKTKYPQDKTLQQLFETQVEKTPDNIAVSFENEALTYRELNQKANQLAHYLRQQGISPEVCAAIYMERGIESIIATLGIVKAGGAYVPLDPAYPLSRIQLMLDDSRAVVVLTLSIHLFHLKSQLPTGIVLLAMDDSEFLNKQSVENPIIVTKNNSLVYVMYTSGSTGQPKGIEIVAKGIVRLVKNSNYIQIVEQDCIAHISNPTFDASTFEIWGALLNGAKLVIFSQDEVFNLPALVRGLSRSKVTIVWFTALLFSQLLEYKPNFFNFLRVVLFGGEAPTRLIVDRLSQRKKADCKLIHIYGPTENTSFTTFYDADFFKGQYPFLPIGSPVANTSVYILGRKQQLMPVGAVGELYVGKDGLARGYKNRPSLTVDKFIKSPFPEENHEFLYKTGDLVRWLPEGLIEFVGRIDDQIKVRGFRIETAEIEMVLVQHPAIAEAKLLLQRNSKDQDELIAFVIRNKIDHNSVSLGPEKIREFLKDKIPGYMLPTHFCFMDDFPLNPNGKIDRVVLLNSFKDLNFSLVQQIKAPVTEKQKILCEIWFEVFGRQVGTEENFFDLGGDSIQAIQIVAKARQRHLLLEVRQIFQYPTISQLAFKIEKSVGKKHQKKRIFKNIALTPIQRWFFDQPFVDFNAFSQACLVTIKKLANSKGFLDALYLLLKSYDAFRLAFYMRGGNYLQSYVKSEPDFSNLVKIIDVAEYSNKRLNIFINKLVNSVNKGFSLKNGWLVKCFLLRLNEENDYKLLIVAHHLIVDGVSWRILLSNIEKILQNFSMSSANFLCQTDTFQDWSKAIQQYSTDKKIAALKNYWVNVCGKQCPIPFDHPNGSNIEKSSQKIQLSLTKEETSFLIGQLTRDEKISVNELLISAAASILADWCHSDEVVLDLESHGRSDVLGVDTSSVVGWLTSLFPICLNYKRHLSFDENLSIIKESLSSIPNNGIDYGIFHYILNDADFSALKSQYRPKISFNYWGQLDQIFSKKHQLSFEWIRLISDPENVRTHFLNIEAVIQEEKLHVTWIYSKNIHHKSTITDLANRYIFLLRSFIEKKQSSQNINLVSSSPLTAMQKGLLFHTISAPGCEAYMVQLHWELSVAVKVKIFKQALQKLIDQYDILRTSFVWENLKEPLQIVHKKASLKWQEYNWEDADQDASDDWLEPFLKANRQVGFSFKENSLFRVTLIKKKNKRYHVVVNFHHILLDGRSISLIFTRLGSIYNVLLNGEKIIFSNTPSYFSYIEWLQQQKSKKFENFWSKYLANLDNVALLSNTPLFKKYIQTSPINYHSEMVTLSLPLTQKVQEYCRKYQITLNTLFQGLWAIFLGRYTQAEDIVWGITASVRPPELVGSNQMVGLLINTVPLRVRLDNSISVVDYFVELQKNILIVLDHAHMPLTLVQAGKQEDKKRAQDLFETIVVVENYETQEIPGLHVRFKDIKIIDPTHYPLTLAVFPDENIFVKFSYDLNRIEFDRLQEVKGYFNTVLSDILDNPTKNIGELGIFYNAKTREAAVEIHKPKFSKTLHKLFEDQVLKTPKKVALKFKDEALTYQELNAKANQLAHFLIKSDFKPQMFVVLYMERSFDIIISILAILKVGGIYIPVDPSYPKARLEYVLNDSLAPFVISHSHLLQEPEGFSGKAQVILLDKIYSLTEKELACNLPDTDVSHLIYVIYTSGSTGKPKGVLVEHRNVLNLFNGMKRFFHFNENDCWTLFHSFSFDFTVWEMFGALIYGGKLILVPEEGTKDLEIFYDLFIKEKVTVANMTTRVFYKIIDIDSAKQLKNNLRYLIFGGEALSKDMLTPWFKMHGYKNPTMANVYGVTETTVLSTCHIIDEEDLAQDGGSIIGKPMQDKMIYILDKDLREVQQNMPGEIHMCGPCVARGYLNNDKLTREKFIDASFLTGAPGLLYKTGDLARWLPDGNIEYVGRVDDQVKIRGFRIELGEVQAQIEKCPSVAKATVICQDLDSDKIIVAYVVKKKKSNLDATKLRYYLAEFLPAHMLPAVFVFLKDIPLNINGKVDKNALPPVDNRQILSKKYAVATNQNQKILVNIFCKILRLKKVGVYDNFFEIGGDSFSAFDILSSVRKEFDIDISLRVFLTDPNIAALEREISLLFLERGAFHAATRFVVENSLVSCLIPLKPTGKKAPLFLIHPVGGTVFWYIALARYLDIDRPLYGIQDPGIEAKEIPFDSVEEMARHYVQSIRSIQPSGPYYIGGASGGSNLSIEVAHQLEMAGETLNFLGSFDGWGTYPDVLHNQAFFEAIMHRQYNTMQSKFSAKKIFQAEKLLNLQWQRSKMLAAFQLPIVKSKLTLFKPLQTTDVFIHMDEPFNQLRPYCTQAIDLYRVPGDHESMFEEPHVRVLTEKLNEVLQK